MRDLTYLIGTTLDGFIAGPGGDFSVKPSPPDLIAATAELYPETFLARERDVLGLDGPGRRFDTVIMGLGTYTMMARNGDSSPYPHLRQYVLTDGGEPPVRHPDVTFTDAPAVDFVNTLRREESGLGIWLCGGSRLAASLVDEIDRLVLRVCPVILGGGVPLFAPTITPHPQEFLSARTLPSGAMIISYRRPSGPCT
jgi:dihydrofolate reductase